MSADRSASVLARLLNRSRSTGENYNLLLSRFAIERLLYRLSVSPRTSELDGSTRVDAICATFARRNTSLPTSVPAALTAEFSSNPVKSQQWRAFVTKADPQTASLDEVIGTLGAFLGPAMMACELSNRFESTWSPMTLQWATRASSTQSLAAR